MKPGYLIAIECAAPAIAERYVQLLANTFKENLQNAVNASSGENALSFSLENLTKNKMSPLSTALLAGAVYAECLRDKINPGLCADKIVLVACFRDFLKAYWQFGEGLAPATVRKLEKMIFSKTRPNYTIILEVDENHPNVSAKNPHEKEKVSLTNLGFARLNLNNRASVSIDANRKEEEVLFDITTELTKQGLLVMNEG